MTTQAEENARAIVGSIRGRPGASRSMVKRYGIKTMVSRTWACPLALLISLLLTVRSTELAQKAHRADTRFLEIRHSQWRRRAKGEHD